MIFSSTLNIILYINLYNSFFKNNIIKILNDFFLLVFWSIRFGIMISIH